MRPATIDVIAASAPCSANRSAGSAGTQGCRRGPGGRGGAHPYLAEIGLVGRTPDKYNLYLGAAFDGSRLNKLCRQDMGHDEIVAALTPLIERHAKERGAGERFGDFVIRKGYVAQPLPAATFTPTLVQTSQHKPIGWALRRSWPTANTLPVRR